MILKTGSKTGLSLIEILVAVAILSLGFIIVYEIFFICLDLFNYYADYLKLGVLLEEKFWQIKDVLSYQESPVDTLSSGIFLVNNRSYFWNLNYDLVDKETKTYRIDLLVSGQIGKRKAKFLRTAYVIYKGTKQYP